MVGATTRKASHAGSWYESNAASLSAELDDYLSRVPETLDGKALPIPGARIIIAPHAGYSYSGPCAAWAYKALDLSKAKRVFILGPSHTYYLRGAALTRYDHYATPFGNLTIDQEVVARLRETLQFEDIPTSSDVSEHSLEMHLPYLWKRLEQTHGGPGSDAAASFPPIVPILVGDNDRAGEKNMAAYLAPYLADDRNAFIVSSDFCHWGRRFSYTAYVPGGADTLGEVRQLSRRGGGGGDLPPGSQPIHEGIRVLDQAAMDAVETGSHDALCDNLRLTGNTVCGRHPIGVVMAALELALQMKKKAQGGGGDDDSSPQGSGKFKFVQYQRSSLVEDVDDSSVSYGAAYAIV